jgi:starvation-inducible DNA-binding protein
MDPKIGLSEQVRERVIGILNATLADEHALYVKTRNYHWNVTGPQFHSLHEMLEEFYQKLAPLADEVAERVRMMGGRAIGTMAEFTQQMRLTEEPGQAPAARQMVENLLADHEQIIRDLRKDIDVCSDELKDQGTVDFLTGLMEQHEKMAWMHRALLEGRSVGSGP